VPTEIAGKRLNLPAGFTIEEYASGIGSARFLTFGDDNTMYVGTKDNDKIYAVSDADNDGKAESVVVIEEGLTVPHSVKYYQGDLFLAEETSVSVYRQIQADGSYQSKEVLIEGLPGGNRLTGGGHRTRTIDIGPDEKIYLTIGSLCNVCEEEDERRATMMRFDMDGNNGEIIASGLRNTVGYDFAEDGTIWSADMGRDQIGDDIPSEEVNIIRPGGDYGWPYCWGSGYFNPEYPEQADYCRNQTVLPEFNMQAHSAPLGVSFLNQAAKDTWPAEIQDGLLVAFHGSWNRTTPTGYKVVWLDLRGDQIKQYTLISGWLEDNAEAWGRPVGLDFDDQGNLYVSDDKRGVIYKVSYQP
jgi:glucose/arabinose dehydrogenase